MTTYLFPGQGSQKKGMGGNLFDEFPKLTAVADKTLGYSIKSLCLDDKNSLLNNTQYTQPALYVVNALAYEKSKQESGALPNFVAGHSLGEINALFAAGAFNFETGLKLVKKRGALMAEAKGGAMAAILKMDVSAIQECLGAESLHDIAIANYNSASQTVISGPKDQINFARDYFEKAGALFILLKTSGAFHSIQMKSAENKFGAYLKRFKLDEPKIPVISNVFAAPYQKGQIVNTLTTQITSPVKWLQSMQYLVDLGENNFQEIGSSSVLTKFISDIKSTYVPKAVKSKGFTKSTTSIIKNNPVVDTKKASSNLSGNPLLAKNGLLKKREEEINYAEALVSSWNSHNQIGTRVKVRGLSHELVTRTAAMLLYGHQPAIYIEGYSGYFSLNEIDLIGEFS